MTKQEANYQALSNARNNQSVMNYAAIYDGLIARGIPELDIEPRVNVAIVIITLSNGTRIAHVKLENGATDAVVLPDGRATTDSEWAEYAAWLRGLTVTESRTRLAERFPNRVNVYRQYQGGAL